MKSLKAIKMVQFVGGCCSSDIRLWGAVPRNDDDTVSAVRVVQICSEFARVIPRLGCETSSENKSLKSLESLMILKDLSSRKTFDRDINGKKLKK